MSEEDGAEAAAAARAAQDRCYRADLGIALALAVCTAGLLCATAGSIGLTYDEPNYISASAKAWTWAGLLAQAPLRAADPSLINGLWRQNHERPGFIKLWWGGWMAVGSFLPPLVGSRLGTVVLVALLVAAVYLWVSRESGRGAALVAATTLLGMPRFFFHAHLAALDASVAVFCFLAAWLFWGLWREPRWGRAVLAGLALGCAAGTKGNVLPAALALGLWWLVRERRAVTNTSLAALVVAPMWFFITWPWLWPAPLSRLLEYLAFHGKFPLLGAFIFGRMRDPAPAVTPIVMLLATTPLLTLALALFSGGEWRCPLWQFLALNLAVHWLYFALPGQPRFNGVRLFLPAFPFLACLAGMGAAKAAEMGVGALRRPQARRWALAFVVALVGVVGLRNIALSHPYELAFYNCAVGGARGARRVGLETIYWGSAYLQALPYLNRNVPAGGSLFVTPVGVMSLLETYQKGGMLRPDIRIVGGAGEHLAADLVVFQCQQSEFVEVSSRLYGKGRPCFALTYEGVPLLLVYERAEVRRVFGAKGD